MIGSTFKRLDNVLQTLQLTSVFYCQSSLKGSWGVSFPTMPHTIMFHLVTQGRCLVAVGKSKVWINAGDFILIPHGNGHSLKSQESAKLKDIFSYERELKSPVFETLNAGNGKDETIMLCGFVRLDNPVSAFLINSLPSIISFRSQATQLSIWTQVIKEELIHPKLGSDTILSRMTDILIIQSLRNYVLESKSLKGWIGAFRDPIIGKSLEILHSSPEKEWNLDLLAKATGVSRSGLAALFTKKVGLTPIKYLTTLRMSIVADEIVNNQVTVAQLSERFGYSSESAFRKAFKQVMGKNIGEYRSALLDK